MKAVILAGGEGTRLRPLTLSTPKPVVPVCNIPFLRYQIELLKRHGIHEVILSLGYQPRKIEEVLGDGSSLGSRIHYVVERSPLGTAGAYKNAEPLLDDATVVFNGDILCDLDLGQVIAQHRSRKATATLVLTRVENPSAYGLVETEADGRITRFLEKPGKDEITCN
ncbi:MAG: nucleotidyltransferase family protein, partial [Terriglobia bacterium]